MNLKATIKKLPDSVGIYKFQDKENNLLYVGKATSLKKRVASYFQNKTLGPKTDTLVKKIAKISHIKVFSEFEALLLEAQLIRTFQPFFNTAAKDDKSPIYVKITSDEVPQVQLTRKPKASSRDFVKGPFPSAKTTREVLKITRRIFPYCHHKNPKKPCLYVHLGLCPDPYKSPQAKAIYRTNIIKIKKLLKGESKNLTKDLKKEMAHLASLQKFEEANEIKRQIQKLQYTTTTYHPPSDFLQRPTLVDDLTNAKLKSLKDELNLKKTPKRIECFDISNISGKNATGSMIVFENGQPKKSDYRRFKIRQSQKIDDLAMLKEVLMRRYKNNWPLADLTVVDGGKGQLSTAQNLINNLKINTKVIALAKRQEEIYIPDKIFPLALSKENPARQLLQAIRDEAHRFAITYHRHLRSKQLFT